MPPPYNDISDLPSAVRSHLPLHAQEIYLAAFNNAWQRYAGRSDQEDHARRIAWAAVKKVYVKVGTQWVRR